jgi:hypothetical protein
VRRQAEWPKRERRGPPTVEGELGRMARSPGCDPYASMYILYVTYTDGGEVDVMGDLTATEVRGSWATALNAAAEGRPVVFHRGDQDFALLPAALLREVLRRAVPAPEVIAEGDGWTVLLPGHPVAADGLTLEDALRDFVSALRDYADAWTERLHRAPNHQHAASLIHHVVISDDGDLVAWARGSSDQVARQQA